MSAICQPTASGFQIIGTSNSRRAREYAEIVASQMGVRIAGRGVRFAHYSGLTGWVYRSGGAT